MNAGGSPRTQCDVSSSLSESEYVYDKCGWPDRAINLPETIGSRCPECDCAGVSLPGLPVAGQVQKEMPERSETTASLAISGFLCLFRLVRFFYFFDDSISKVSVSLLNSIAVFADAILARAFISFNRALKSSASPSLLCLRASFIFMSVIPLSRFVQWIGNSFSCVYGLTGFF